MQTEIARIEAERALATARDSSVEHFGDFGGMSSEGFRAAAEQLAELDRQIAAVQVRRSEMLASDEGGNFLDIERELATSSTRGRSSAGSMATSGASGDFGLTREAAAGLAAAVIACR